MGGAGALATIKSLQLKAIMRQWEPEQSYVAGAKIKFAVESRFVLLVDVVADAARIGWVTDLWALGRDVIKDSLNATQLAVVNTVRKAGIAPLRFAGGHGGVASYPELAAEVRAAQ